MLSQSAQFEVLTSLAPKSRLALIQIKQGTKKMSEVTKTIQKLLKDEAVQHALSKDALQQFLDELDQNQIIIKDQNETIEALSKAEEKLGKELKFTQEIRDEHFNNLKSLQERIKNLDERETVCLGTEIRNEYEKKRGDEFKDLMHATVRNATIRKTMLGEQVVATAQGIYNQTNGQYDGATYAQKEPVETKTEETQD